MQQLHKRFIELVEFSTNLENTQHESWNSQKKDTQMNECLRKKEMFEQAQLVLEFSSPRRIYILAQHDTDDYYKRHLKRE